MAETLVEARKRMEAINDDVANERVQRHEGFRNVLASRYEQLNRELTDAVERFQNETSLFVRHISVEVSPGRPANCEAGVLYGDVPQERAMLQEALAQANVSARTMSALTAMLELIAQDERR
jgi:hypothetical protein